MISKGQARARPGGEQGAVDSPVQQEGLHAIQGKALADAAEVDLPSRFEAVNRGLVGINHEAPDQRRRRARQSVLSVLNLAAERDVKETAGLDVGFEGEPEAVVAGLREEKRLAAFHLIDLPDVAPFNVAAEGGFDCIDQVNCGMGRVACAVRVARMELQPKGGLHRFMSEMVAVRVCAHFSSQSSQRSLRR